MTREWLDEAACTTVDPEIFFRDGESGWNQYTDAARVCASCPVRAQCYAAGVAEGDEDSFRAGLTPNQRKKLRRKAAA